MGFVRNDEVKICRRESPAKFVVEEKRLNCGHDDVGLSPIVLLFLVNDTGEVVLEKGLKRLIGLDLQLDSVDQKQHSPRVAGLEKQFDDSC